LSQRSDREDDHHAPKLVSLQVAAPNPKHQRGDDDPREQGAPIVMKTPHPPFRFERSYKPHNEARRPVNSTDKGAEGVEPSRQKMNEYSGHCDPDY
jgi:hypothetical protein